jgi:hypothetical protein
MELAKNANTPLSISGSSRFVAVTTRILVTVIALPAMAGLAAAQAPQILRIQKAAPMAAPSGSLARDELISVYGSDLACHPWSLFHPHTPDFSRHLASGAVPGLAQHSAGADKTLTAGLVRSSKEHCHWMHSTQTCSAWKADPAGKARPPPWRVYKQRRWPQSMVQGRGSRWDLPSATGYFPSLDQARPKNPRYRPRQEYRKDYRSPHRCACHPSPIPTGAAPANNVGGSSPPERGQHA